jgi:hypothetical protein
MSTMMVPADMDDAMKMLDAALGMQQCVLGFLAAQDAAGLPAGAAAGQLRALERADAVGAALRGRLLVVFDAQAGYLADGQRTTRTPTGPPTRCPPGTAAPGSKATRPVPSRSMR